MSTSKRFCRNKEEHVGSIIYWQCRRRSHPVQKMGGVCAMCLTERLSKIARCAAETAARSSPQLTDAISFGHPPSAGMHSQSVQCSVGIALDRMNLCKQVHMSAQQCDSNVGVHELMSARDSSAGSEQSIASLIEREIDEGRRRSSDVTTGTKELLVLESSSDRLASAKQQLARSRSCSTNSQYFSSLLSTPASYKSKSSMQSCADSCNFRSVAEDAAGRVSSDHALLTKSKSTGSNFSHHANKLRSPSHLWSLPNFWHKKCTHIMGTRRHDASSSHDLPSTLMQADHDSVPFMEMPRSCSKIATGGVKMCLGFKWFTPPRPFHLTRRSTSNSGFPTSNFRRSSSACAQQSLSSYTQEVGAASSISSTEVRSNCKRWQLPRFLNMSRCSRIAYTPIESGQLQGNIFASNRCSANDFRPMSHTEEYQCCKSRDCKDGSAGHGAEAVNAQSANGEEGAENELCIDGAIVAAEKSLDAAGHEPGGVMASNHKISTSSASSTTSTCGRAMMMTMHMQPNRQCQSIAALVNSMDGNLIPLV